MTKCQWCGKEISRQHAKGPMPTYCSNGYRQRDHEARKRRQHALAVSILRKIVGDEHEFCWLQPQTTDVVIDGRYTLTADEAAYLQSLRYRQDRP